MQFQLVVTASGCFLVYYSCYCSCSCRSGKEDNCVGAARGTGSAIVTKVTDEMY